MLEVQVDGVSMANYSEPKGISNFLSVLVQEIINILKYPYDLRLPDVTVENLRVLIDLHQLNLQLPEKGRHTVPHQIQTLLSRRGFNLDVLTSMEEANYYILVKF